MDTEQYYTVADVMDKAVVMLVPYIDLDSSANRVSYMGLDSRAANKVNGVQLFEVYILVK